MWTQFFVKGETVAAQRDLLVAKSPVLRERFMAGEQLACFDANDSTVAAIKTMITFMSTQEVVLSNDTDLDVIADALHCANRFRVNGLVAAIVRHLETLMTIESVETIAELLFAYDTRELSDTLAALLNDRNVVIVADIAFKYGPPSELFLAALMTCLYANFDKTVAKVLHESILANGRRKTAANSEHTSRTTSRALALVGQASSGDRSQGCVDAATAGDAKELAKKRKNHKKSNSDECQESAPKRKKKEK